MITTTLLAVSLAGLRASEPVTLATPGGTLYGMLEVLSGGPAPVVPMHAGSDPDIFKLVEAKRARQLASYGDPSLPVATKLLSGVPSFVRKVTGK